MSDLPLSVPEARAILEADRLCDVAHNDFVDEETMDAWVRIVKAAKARLEAWKPLAEAEGPQRCPATSPGGSTEDGQLPRKGARCGLPAGHDGEHTVLVPTGSPWSQFERGRSDRCALCGNPRAPHKFRHRFVEWKPGMPEPKGNHR